MATTITRPAVRYFGSKWRLAPTVIQLLGEHYCYIEPYAGSAAVLLRKPRSEFEVMNDLDGSVVNFWRVLRDSPQELARAVALTPYARTEQQSSRQKCDCPIEAARRFAVRCWQAFSPGKQSGWRFQRKPRGPGHRRTTAVTDWVELPERLAVVAERLRGVAIESDEARAVIKRFDGKEAAFFVDPPYPHDTRYDSRGYGVEMSNEEHRQLLEDLVKLQGRAVVSTYPNELYTDALSSAGWRQIETSAHTNKGGTFRTEQLWCSPQIEVKREVAQQVDLWKADD